MGKRCISNENLSTTGFSYTLSLINGKYKMTILYTLMEFGVVRFNEMKKYIGQISYKTLSSTLKELEADQLIIRKEYPQIPPKVEYMLSERGRSLMNILDQLDSASDYNAVDYWDDPMFHSMLPLQNLAPQQSLMFDNGL